MKRAASCAIIVVALVSLAPLSAQDARPRAKWWDSPDTQAALHLTADQVAKIDALFQSTLPQRQALLRQLNELEAAEDTLLSEATLDDDAAMRVIERVEAVRSQRNAARAMLLYRMRQVLTPDQRRWFDQRRNANRPNRPAGRAGASAR